MKTLERLRARPSCIIAMVMGITLTVGIEPLEAEIASPVLPSILFADIAFWDKDASWECPSVYGGVYSQAAGGPRDVAEVYLNAALTGSIYEVFESVTALCGDVTHDFGLTYWSMNASLAGMLQSTTVPERWMRFNQLTMKASAPLAWPHSYIVATATGSFVGDYEIVEEVGGVYVSTGERGVAVADFQGNRTSVHENRIRAEFVEAAYLDTSSAAVMTSPGCDGDGTSVHTESGEVGDPAGSPHIDYTFDVRDDADEVTVCMVVTQDGDVVVERTVYVPKSPPDPGPPPDAVHVDPQAPPGDGPGSPCTQQAFKRDSAPEAYVRVSPAGGGSAQFVCVGVGDTHWRVRVGPAA